MSCTQIILRKFLTTKNNLLYLGPKSCNVVTCKMSTKDTKGTTESSSSSSSSDSDEDTTKNKKPLTKATNDDAVSKLNILLQQMMDDSLKSKINLELAHPPNKRAAGRQEKEQMLSQTIENKASKAAKEVAESLGGDTKQTESELLMKLLSPAGNVSSAANLSDILKGMKIERESKPTQQSKADEVRNILQRFNKSDSPQRSGQSWAKRQRTSISNIPLEDVTLFQGESLGIFTEPEKLKEIPQLKTWEKLYKKELKLAITHPPANYFQEMILWTEQGKLWQFPINNEFGLEEESKVYFADHVFLEEHLEPWCPSKGPLRHFMELVCVGLSKNCYLTVQAKKDHIEWFKNYFEEKRTLLQEVGAFPTTEEKLKRIEEK